MPALGCWRRFASWRRKALRKEMEERTSVVSKALTHRGSICCSACTLFSVGFSIYEGRRHCPFSLDFFAQDRSSRPIFH